MDGNLISWVEFTPYFHTHLVKCTLALVPHGVPMGTVKRVMFVFILEVLNCEALTGFFNHALPCKYSRAKGKASSVAKCNGHYNRTPELGNW